MGWKVVASMICPYPSLWNLWLLSYMVKEWILTYLAKHVIKLRTLRGEIHPGLSRWVINIIKRILLRKWRGSYTQRRRLCGNGAQRNVATCQGMPAATRSWKRQEMDPALELAERVCSYRKTDFLFLASRAVGEQVSVVLIYSVCTSLLQLQEAKMI